MENYEKPILVCIELRPEERLAKNSKNCAAAQGSVNSPKNPCTPGTAWSGGNDVP